LGCTDDIEMRVIADVQHLRRPHRASE
jgi:hypothetical protein